MEPVAGLEPATYGLQNRCSTAELHRQKIFIVIKSLQPFLINLLANCVCPLLLSRGTANLFCILNNRGVVCHPKLRRSEGWWAGRDSNPRRRKPADLQSAPFDRFGTYPYFKKTHRHSSEKRHIRQRNCPL